MSDDLLPCPFCGGEAYIDGTSWTTRDGKDQSWVTCMKCGTYGPSSTDAIAAWNRRAIPATDEREKALREAAAMFDEDSNIAQTILALIGASRDEKEE